ncbi:MAG: tRNA (N(6)-L-threonylcarbamoyladenosine(37)-C(2))-methylthiotransferase MtaB [Paraprevotella sp.]|nr:tRNA (N(6)-L-threonylcarbamoyladenosine(37)-C(2))-methylthiotransferase MtaB [Paraprevotella sp.]
MTEASVFEGKKAVYFTLGCKLNFAETSSIGRLLKQMGVGIVRPGEHADICVVNTCSVTEMADHKCRQAIHKLVKQHPGAFVVVTGCYAQLKPDQVAAIDGVDLVLGAEQKGDILRYLEERLPLLPKERVAADAVHEMQTGTAKDIRTFVPSCSCGERTRYFLKVQDGCDYYCTYCTIPYARGRSRNGTIESLVNQARQVVAEGGREIVLTGVNIGDFGKTTGESFLDLVKALDHVDGISRYRISSIEPNLLTDEILEYCAASRAFMPHFHIPLQSGSDEMLKLMHRRYTTDFFARKLARIKKIMPNAFIGVDVIVCMRGETSTLFEETYQFLRALDISQLHVFSYSERPGTAALRIDHVVSPEEKHQRSQRLLELSNEKWERFYHYYIGTEAEVLLEKSKTAGVMHGFTTNYIRVELPVEECLDNQIVRVRLGDFNPDRSALCATRV